MTRMERLAVLVALLVVLGLLVTAQPVAGGLGTLAGIAAGLPVADRLSRVRRKVDARLGSEIVAGPKGLRTQVVVRRVLLQIGILGALLVVAVFTPFVGDRAFAAAAAAATALPAVLTVQRLRG